MPHVKGWLVVGVRLVRCSCCATQSLATLFEISNPLGFIFHASIPRHCDLTQRTPRVFSQHIHLSVFAISAEVSTVLHLLVVFTQVHATQSRC
jgi:hypothetical protein